MIRVNDTFRQVDKFGAGKDGYTEGDPGVTPRTTVRAVMMDHLQEEIARAIEAPGTALNSAVYEQLLRAIRAGDADTAFSNWSEHAYAGTVINDGVDAACLFSNPASDVENWVIVHLGGEISYSEDGGASWSEATSPTANNLRAVSSNGSPTAVGTLFVAVGDAGTIITSPTGTGSWTTRTPGGGYAGNFQHVHFGGGLWVAVGATGGIQTSPDGITWTQRTPAASYAGTFNGGVYSGSLHTIVGTSGEIQTSPDGITWTHRTPAASFAGVFNAVAYGHGYFVAVADDPEIQRSADGITWSAVTEPFANAYADVAFCAGLFVLISSAQGLFAVSVDGTAWKTRRFDGFGAMNGLGAGPGRLIIATPNGAERSLKAGMLLSGA